MHSVVEANSQVDVSSDNIRGSEVKNTLEEKGVHGLNQKSMSNYLIMKG